MIPPLEAIKQTYMQWQDAILTDNEAVIKLLLYNSDDDFESMIVWYLISTITENHR